MKKALHLKRALRTALLVLLLSVVGMGKGIAQTFTVDGMKYSINGDGSSVTIIKFCGEPNEYDGSYYWSIIIPSTINYNGRTYSVTTIGDGAFHITAGSDYLSTHITISESVTSIGKDAFYISMPRYIPLSIGYTGSIADWCGIKFANRESNPLIYSDSFVTFSSPFGHDVEIPDGVESIGQYAFCDYTKLNSITIPNSVTEIGQDAFCGCSGLTSVTIPHSVNKIGQEAFRDCSSLTSVSLSNSLDSINKYTFMGCTNLTSISIPDSIVSIGYNAFCNCNGLIDLTIPNSVNSIGANAFDGCTGLTSLKLGNSVTSIGSRAFIGCSNIAGNLIIPNSVNHIGSYAFSGCTGLTSLELPNTIDTLENRAFSGCDGLASVIIPKSVSSIGNAFNGCSRLTTVYWNAENAEGSSVFSKCPNLTTLHIGPDVREIGTNIFKGSTGVHLVVAMGPTPATLVGNAFADFADNSILQVSCNKRMAYYSVWNMFDFDHIIEDCGEYSVSMDNVGTGGSVTTSESNAKMGDVVTLTVNPNPGMHLSSLTVCNASDPTQIIPVSLVGKASSTYSFTMPPFGVVVMATFATGTSVGEINNKISAVVYPNPTNGNVKIEASDLRHVSIFNALGQQVYDGSADGDVFEYDFTKHEAGIYLVRIETAKGVTTKRVAVTK